VESKFAEDNGEDCVRTFCTEDTPYNFSNSTSLSDLRITEGDGGELSACKVKRTKKSLIEVTITAKVISSRKRREKEDRIGERQPFRE
jgi:APC cysteine-rich region.